ncbi:OmpL47-type beta-barrel domain-containing protein [Saccharothrix sp. NRRL B-16314]|uniref:OmpL47-type beta-barrel domain-containing protein n=1 Tax=Saccharothrix sp. NRRL B-16314 TaxID=1463825 RepID=UPI0005273A97|nr:copper-binding protein [Saccharothrix sp. NRRL B-16314]
MFRRPTAAVAAALMWVSLTAVIPASALPAAPVHAQEQVLTWTADNDITRYKSAPTTAAAGVTKIVFENSEATGNTTGMPHTLTFDTATPGYNQDVALNILANPFDAQNGRHEATVTLTPGKYRYLCTIPGHGTMAGEFTVTAGDEDTTAPTVTAEVTGRKNSAGDFVGEATVTVTASDAGSGVALVEHEVDDTGFVPHTQPVRVTAIGDHSVQYRATDRAGNTSEIGSVSFRVVQPPSDSTPPEVSADVAGTKDAEGRYVGKATVTVTATDPESGVRSREYQLHSGPWTAYTAPFEVTAPGSHMVHYRATDNAGNVSPEGMVAFTVVAPPGDTTPPSTSAVVSGATNPDGDYVDSATVTITATDPESGVDRVEYAVDGGGWTAYSSAVVVGTAGTHAVRYRATDKAGNTAAEKSVTLTVVEPGGDACPDSDTRATVIIGQDDTGVPNTDTGNGCTVSDLVDQDGRYADHGAFVRHVDLVTSDLVARGVLTSREQSAIVRAASRSDIGE